MSEFDSADSPGSGNQMRGDTLLKLDRARGIADMPFVITSGFRTEAHNAKVRGVKGSAHTKGCAADIAFRTEAQALAIVCALTKAGFDRIGLSLVEKFVHADDDPDKPAAYWSYSPYMPHVA